MKITFMGAGSTIFVRNIIGDCMCVDALKDSEFALYDIDAERLKESETILAAIQKGKGGCGKITSYCGVENRKEALRGASFVVDAIQVGLYDPCTIIDFEVPKKYGLRQTIADTLGIGGIMRALRTIPVMDDFARDMEEVCPDAWFLNYTNPIPMAEPNTVNMYPSIGCIGSTALLSHLSISTSIPHIIFLCYLNKLPTTPTTFHSRKARIISPDRY